MNDGRPFVALALAGLAAASAIRGSRGVVRAGRQRSVEPLESYWTGVDHSEVRGNLDAIEPVLEAARRRKVLLLVGPPGTGKSMLARRFGGLLGKMSPTLQAEVEAIHTKAGLRAPSDPFLKPLQRQFRSPHWTVSAAGLLGDRQGRAGEIELAHGGVLFLDEADNLPRANLVAVADAFTNQKLPSGRPADFRLILAADENSDWQKRVLQWLPKDTVVVYLLPIPIGDLVSGTNHWPSTAELSERVRGSRGIVRRTRQPRTPEQTYQVKVDHRRRGPRSSKIADVREILARAGTVGLATHDRADRRSWSVGLRGRLTPADLDRIAKELDAIFEEWDSPPAYDEATFEIFDEAGQSVAARQPDGSRGVVRSGRTKNREPRDRPEFRVYVIVVNDEADPSVIDSGWEKVDDAYARVEELRAVEEADNIKVIPRPKMDREYGIDPEDDGRWR